ncbi:D-Lactate dehydrogenase [Prochlorococcus sp. MIT 0602]|uniref:D-lactate dehydrogenase n=1 Tax=unclassified Prochlorococcus TaxID=2627481 RepID=UPI000533A6B4|nr:MULTISPECIES: D-lactate dehydrogenase [unclassified Prochlorococcus]KGG14632.1 D-Lactate dehydrogenase [Prochlorococcus sp. MIT 0602]KGG15939.1 D-Lactate dehydrogenase [Prochlorococcus sp. MIT 0603]
MIDDRLLEIKEKLKGVVGRSNLLIDKEKTRFYSKGIRVGGGDASMVVLPNTLLEFWKSIEISIKFDKVIIIQAANTGLTGGSTPYGNDYDRDVIIINTMLIDKLIIINNGAQIIALPGTTLYQLEDRLLPLGRGPHSVIGSSCIGASVVGGVCNNSGGNLVNRGPAYTELSLFAKLNKNRELELINHLGIELGNSPEDILTNLESVAFDKENIPHSVNLASDCDYQMRVRDINANTPARFNADTRRLYESSGCAGKIAVFAVRLDTFPIAKKEQVFFVGTNNPKNFTKLRERVLLEHSSLPEMGEYIHRSYFDGSDKYCKDNFLFIKYFGTKSLPNIFLLKRSIDRFANNFKFLPDNLMDKFLQLIAGLIPDHLPHRIREYRDKFEHYMLILSSEKSISLIENLLNEETNNSKEYEYIKCTKREGEDALLHRYVAGYAPTRYQKLHSLESNRLIPLDVALPRNYTSWYEVLPKEILTEMAEIFQMGHFLCMVFHLDFVVKEGVDSEKLKSKILDILDKCNAKYPAEHNVGHLYDAETNLKDFYKELDPTNTFNSGIGKTSKKRNYD